VNGLTISKRARVLRNGLMARSMRETSPRAKNLGMVISSGLMGLAIRESLRTIRLRDTGLISETIRELMLAAG